MFEFVVVFMVVSLIVCSCTAICADKPGVYLHKMVEQELLSAVQNKDSSYALIQDIKSGSKKIRIGKKVYTVDEV